MTQISRSALETALQVCVKHNFQVGSGAIRYDAEDILADVQNTPDAQLAKGAGFMRRLIAGAASEAEASIQYCRQVGTGDKTADYEAVAAACRTALAA